MTFSKCRYLIRSDLYRYFASTSIKSFLKCYFIIPGFRYSFWLRLGYYVKFHPFLKSLYPFIFLINRRLSYKFGFDIPVSTNIGSGFYIGHFSGIIVSGLAQIGCNCNISQGVTIGASNRGGKLGTPTIGDNVYIGPGAKIFGNITIGNNVAIGANAVITKDCADNSVIVGIPGKVLNYSGSHGYINRTDY